MLKKAYRCGAQEIADALRDIAGSVNVSVDRPAVDAGLAALSAGADFADGVIRFEAERLQADRLYTFDRAFARGVDTGKVVLLG